MEKDEGVQVQVSEKKGDDSPQTPKKVDAGSEIGMAHLVYALQAASFFVGFTGIIALIINYVKWSAVKGTWLESHFRWQIRTFWFALLCWAVAAGTFLIVLFVVMIPRIGIGGWVGPTSEASSAILGLGALALFIIFASGLGVGVVWFIYRIVRGWLRLAAHREMYKKY